MKSLRILFLSVLLLLISSSALAQNADQLWARYNDAAMSFGTLYAETEEQDPLATRGNRVYRDTISAGQELVEVLNDLLASGSGISPEERVAALDSLLTTRQIIGSLMVEVQQCEEGLAELEAVLAHPGVSDRPIVEESANRWKVRADTCIQGQALEAERERRAAEIAAEEQRLAHERALREAEIRELEAQIDNEQDEAQLAQLQQRLAEMQGVEWVGPAGPALRRRSMAGPIVVTSVGVLALAGAGIWDLSMSGTRDDFDAALERNDQVALDSLSTEIDNAKLPMGILYGVGGAAALGGLVWVITTASHNGGIDKDDSDLSVAPFFAPDGGGLVLTRSF